MRASASVLVLFLWVCVSAYAAHLPDREEKIARDSDVAEEESNDEYFSSKKKRGWFSIRLDRKNSNCQFSGYKPCGPIADIGQIKSPEATLGSKSGLAAMLSGAKKMGQGAAVAMHAMKFSAKLMKNAPMLGPALGVFSAMTGMINPAPTAQDILNSVNTAVAKLTSEVNKKLDQMKGYVDSKIAKLEKDLIRGEYETNFKLWAACINEPSEELVNECQRDAAKLITASLSKFTPLAHEVKNRKGGSPVSFDNVRKLEAYLLAFRDYANLVIMELTPLLQYYCIAKKNAQYASHYCDVYSNSLSTNAQFFVDYATNAISMIKEGHWGTRKRGNCPNTVRCDGQRQIKEGFWNTHTANYQECRCEIESSNTKKYCQIDFTIRADGKRIYTNYNYPNAHSFGAAGPEYARRLLEQYAWDYQNKNHKIMEKYWQTEVLSFLPEWRNAVALAAQMKSKNPKTSGDAPSMDFSEGFADRLELSGYTEAVQDTMETEDEENEDEVDNIDNNSYEDYDEEDIEADEDDEVVVI